MKFILVFKELLPLAGHLVVSKRGPSCDVPGGLRCCSSHSSHPRLHPSPSGPWRRGQKGPFLSLSSVRGWGGTDAAGGACPRPTLSRQVGVRCVSGSSAGPPHSRSQEAPPQGDPGPHTGRSRSHAGHEQDPGSSWHSSPPLHGPWPEPSAGQDPASAGKVDPLPREAQASPPPP